jgi:hypothetical protein
MVAKLTCPLCREVSNFDLDWRECSHCRFTAWPKEIGCKISAAASDISGWLQDAAGDTAGHNEEVLMMNTSMDSAARKKIKQAKADGVQDLCGWYADEVYDDEDWLYDLTGDRIYDESIQIMQWLGIAGNYEAYGYKIFGWRLKIAIARDMAERGHTSLKNALGKHIESWKDSLLTEIKLQREAEGAAYGDSQIH